MLKKLYGEYVRYGRSLMSRSMWAIIVYRYGVWAMRLRPAPVRWIAGKIYGVLFMVVQILTGTVLFREVKVGKDLRLIHARNILVDPGVVIGDRCVIMHEVTLGSTLGRRGVPKVGNDVFIGCGAKVLGPVKIGDHAIIAANSLVLSDVPPGTTAIGVPARILRVRRSVPTQQQPPDAASATEDEGDEPVVAVVR
jgi:serine O-acetyltransferase